MDGLPVSGLDYWLARHRWLPFVLPFAVYLLVGYFEPRQPSRPTPDLVAATTTDEAQPNAAELDQNEPAGRGPSHFPLIYCAQIAATLLAMWLVRSVYYGVPWRLNLRAGAYGVVGGLLWIVVCRWGLEVRIWTTLGLPTGSKLPRVRLSIRWRPSRMLRWRSQSFSPSVLPDWSSSSRSSKSFSCAGS